MLTTIVALQAQTVKENTFSQLAVSYKAPEEVIVSTTLGGHNYMVMSVPNHDLAGTVGAPALPVFSQLIEIPFCSDIVVSVSNAVYDTVTVDAGMRWLPLQPLRSKSNKDTSTIIDNEVYATDAFVSLPFARVTDIAIARDRRIATLIIAPVAINPLTGQYIVCRSADITVDYVDADAKATIDYYERYSTPEFAVTNTLNNLYASSAKSVRTSAPTRMVIAVPTSLNCSAVNNFANWKRRCGMLVDIVYYGTGSLTSNTALANYFKSLYVNATTDAPAPSYIVLVGDHEQLPAFSSTLSSPGAWSNEPDNDHITDLYFVTWTDNDVVPDCYQGRLSAKDTNTLTSIINKTLLYESYSFPDPVYLGNAVLISGVDKGLLNDDDNAYTYSDPTMDYAARFYVNADNGFDNVKYYKNNTSFAPTGVTVTGSSHSNIAGTLRSLYNNGVGFVNYSAHGDWDRWYQPSLTVSNANAMSNVNKPMVMIGNCCLSNKFEKDKCFGEALLRRGNNAGAVAYIGGTNSTYWPHDFYWSVGVRTNISNTMNTAYNSTNLGMYDRLFHTHGETRINQGITAGAMVFFGNTSVQSASTSASFKKYYWEIYELMGDPSLMPWLGQAPQLTNFSYSTSGATLYIQTVPFAYVAVIDTTTGNLVTAIYTTSGGNANLQLPSGVDLNACSFTVIAQGYRPYFSTQTHLAINLGPVQSEIKLFPNPATSKCTVTCDSMTAVYLLDSRGSLLSTYNPNDSTCVINLEGLPHGVYFVQVQAADTIGTQKLIVK